MLGQDPQPTGSSDERRLPDANREALAESCRAARERLDGIARALAALTDEIDRTLAQGSALPESRTQDARSPSSDGSIIAR